MGDRFVDPVNELGELLFTVEKPARYTGGEYGRLARRGAAKDGAVLPGIDPLKMTISFPDLYEIGMSNQAFRIIYNRLNRIEGIVCDRAFAPAPDFEKLLRERNLPLYGLDTGISLKNLDILCFTLGYELGITGILAMLDVSAIPLHREDRRNGDPIVIMGGPCVSNPRPYEKFIDAFWIGEAEGGFFELAQKLSAAKKAGEGRAAFLSLLNGHPSVWMPGKDRAVRAIDNSFSERKADAAVFPVPSMKTVQHHGAVEIMRGCPNGCRFCHAGYWYRPMRQKDALTVTAEVKAFIENGGYREISLSSLSSGDYRHLENLLEILTKEYSSRHISFQLPSLKVSTFSLPILEKVSQVRRSGLTFAVETPNDAWQLSINKTVSRDTVVSIINKARNQGWRGVKFYFMIGLPPGTTKKDGQRTEEEEIVDFVLDVGQRTHTHFNINVGAFVPKPKTPYQWEGQIDEEAGQKKLDYIRFTLKQAGHKVNTASPFTALIEGVISRGDGRVGDIIEEAYRKGCRLDAWDEFFKKDVWRDVFAEHGKTVQEIVQGKNKGEALPWDCIDSGFQEAYLLGETENSRLAKATESCGAPCPHPCGICPGKSVLVENSNTSVLEQPLPSELQIPKTERSQDAATNRIIFSFSKEGPGIWLSHLSVIEVFSMAAQRGNLPLIFTRGFNPLPKIDFASPISIGMSAEGEIASMDMERQVNEEEFIARLNPQLPEGFKVKEALSVIIPMGIKKQSAAALLWGFAYKRPAIDDNPVTGDRDGLDYVPAKEEKEYRKRHLESGTGLYYLKRKTVLAKRPGNGEEPEWGSYFAVYRELYKPGTAAP
jgi:radical SAM-linked protein